MILKNTPLYVLSLFFSGAVWAQKPTDVLVTINDSIYKVSDFERLYNKNIDIIVDDTQKEVTNYFELYKLYKLKIQEAYKTNLDKKSGIENEYNTYRKELAEKYFVDDKALSKLIDEAFERSEYEINASHILVNVDEFASAADTLKAYNKALEIRKEIENGLDFEEAAVKYSDDLSAKKNKGNLGYFGVFKMVYPFESGAYNTPVGNISMPVRTNFGYHLINITDKRKTSKTKAIAHILVEVKEGNETEARKKIFDLYDKLEKGQNFDDLAYHFSDDIYTRDVYGMLGVYNEGTFDIKGISDVLYDLNYKDAFSKPFLSQYGWHILRVTDIREKLSREELYDGFLRKVKSDSRSEVLEEDLIHHLKDFYKLKINEVNLLKSAKILDRVNMINQPKVEENEETLLAIANYDAKKITIKDLLEHIYAFPTKYSNIKTDELLVKNAFDQYTLELLKKQYDADLEKNFPEFSSALKEYKEGLMLFDLLDTKIWKPVAEDTLSMEVFFNENKSNYIEPPYFIGEVYVFDKKDYANSFQRALNGNYPIKEDDFPLVYKYQGKFYLNDKRIPDGLKTNNLGKKVVDFNKKYYVFKVRDIKEESNPNFAEVKAKVQSDFQIQYEKVFNENLLKNANIKVNEPVLNQLNKKYNKKNLN